jgi:hypothetical protein
VSADSFAIWSAILDRLETEIGTAVSGGTPEFWEPPTGVGPLPAELQAKASRILDAQRECISILEKNRRDLATQLSALDSVPGSGPDGLPLLIDLRG